MVSESQPGNNPRYQGLDYLSFWAFGDFEEGEKLYAFLEEQRENAREACCDRVCTIGGLECVIKPSGGGPGGIYRRVYQLEVGGVYFGFCKPHVDVDRPELKVEIKGEVFTQLGESKALRFVRDCFEAFKFAYKRSKVSRLDLRSDHTDFSVSDVFERFDRGCHVSKAKNFQAIFDSSFEPETFYVGLPSSDISCRIYNKLHEAYRSTAKARLLEACVLDGESPEVLTRVEFQLKRKALVDRYKVDSVEDCFDQLVVIVDDLTRDWLRIEGKKVDRHNSQRGKNSLSDLWQSVKSAFLLFAKSFGERRIKKRIVESEGKEKAANMVVAYCAKIAALEDRTFDGAQSVIAFITEQFQRVGDNVSQFNRRVSDAKKKINGRNLQNAMDFFLNQRLEDAQPLFQE